MKSCRDSLFFESSTISADIGILAKLHCPIEINEIPTDFTVPPDPPKPLRAPLKKRGPKPGSIKKVTYDIITPQETATVSFIEPVV